MVGGRRMFVGAVFFSQRSISNAFWPRMIDAMLRHTNAGDAAYKKNVPLNAEVPRRTSIGQSFVFVSANF